MPILRNIFEKRQGIRECMLLKKNVFVSDGKARVGQKTDFQNQYLKDVLVRAL